MIAYDDGGRACPIARHIPADRASFNCPTLIPNILRATFYVATERL